MKITTQSDINDRVWIKELRVPDRVTGLFVDSGGVQVNVRWFKDGEPKTAYFLESEIGEPPSSEQQTGFSTATTLQAPETAVRAVPQSGKGETPYIGGRTPEPGL